MLDQSYTLNEILTHHVLPVGVRLKDDVDAGFASRSSAHALTLVEAVEQEILFG